MMGIDYSGGMIVGEAGDEIDAPEDYDGDFCDWCEDNDIDRMALHYDADDSFCYFGFQVPNIPVGAIIGPWLEDVCKKAEKFKELTGVEAKLIGTQNIW